MELDTPATVSVISKETWNENLSDEVKNLHQSTPENKRTTFVDVSYNGQNVKLPSQVIEGNEPALKLDWGTIKKVTTDLETVLNQHKGVLKEN